MEYERIRLLKESEKNTVELVCENSTKQTFIRKTLKGCTSVYQKLQSLQHPYLIKVYAASISDNTTTVLEEYIDGRTLGNVELSEKQIVTTMRELCSVLEYLHGCGIIHRDIKPSNIIFAKDGHIRLIDFDAARFTKNEADHDTVLLGTRGFAPPEQYGFAQTDERTDIYALGMTMKQLLEEKADKFIYRRIIEKCTNLNPDKRYRRASQVEKALSGKRYAFMWSCAAILLAGICFTVSGSLTAKPAIPEEEEENTALIALDAPEKPHWDGESGIAVWGNVPESGIDGEVSYLYRIYRKDTPEAPDPEKEKWTLAGDMRGNGAINEENNTYRVNMANELTENGFYYFAVSAVGDGITYEDSPYIMSDAFEYTGADAPMLPAPEGLAWKLFETDKGRQYYATWSNLEDYEDRDSFDVTVYDKDGNYVMNNIWTKAYVVERAKSGIIVSGEFLSDLDGAYRFTVQALTSRPNEYKSSPMPNPVPEEYFSPWYYRY